MLRIPPITRTPTPTTKSQTHPHPPRGIRLPHPPLARPRRRLPRTHDPIQRRKNARRTAESSPQHLLTPPQTVLPAPPGFGGQPQRRHHQTLRNRGKRTTSGPRLPLPRPCIRTPHRTRRRGKPQSQNPSNAAAHPQGMALHHRRPRRRPAQLPETLRRCIRPHLVPPTPPRRRYRRQTPHAHPRQLALRSLPHHCRPRHCQTAWRRRHRPQTPRNQTRHRIHLPGAGRIPPRRPRQSHRRRPVPPPHRTRPHRRRRPARPHDRAGSLPQPLPRVGCRPRSRPQGRNQRRPQGRKPHHRPRRNRRHRHGSPRRCRTRLWLRRRRHVRLRTRRRRLRHRRGPLVHWNM